MEIEITRAVALISINATILAQLVSFLIFMLLISRLMYRPLQDIMVERDRQVEQMKLDIQTAQGDLDDIFMKIEAETQKIKNNALEVEKQLEQEALQKTDEVFEQVNKEIDKLSQETDEEVQRQINEVRKHLEEQSEIISKTIMEKALGRRLTYE
jgi:F-type H+-transporting ATPase subunit b